jgi:hypothetical protein
MGTVSVQLAGDAHPSSDSIAPVPRWKIPTPTTTRDPPTIGLAGRADIEVLSIPTLSLGEVHRCRDCVELRAVTSREECLGVGAGLDGAGELRE